MHTEINYYDKQYKSSKNDQVQQKEIWLHVVKFKK